MEEIKELCDVCGHNMIDDKGCSIIGADISLRTEDGKDKQHPEYERAKSIFGKTEFKICWICWLKSMGVKPKGD